mgnify:CR=1 FL=1
MLDKIIEALNKKEFKAGFICLELENGKDKVFDGIQMIAVDLKGDNESLAKLLCEQSANDIENVDSDFLETFFKIMEENYQNRTG